MYLCLSKWWNYESALDMFKILESQKAIPFFCSLVPNLLYWKCQNDLWSKSILSTLLLLLLCNKIQRWSKIKASSFTACNCIPIIMLALNSLLTTIKPPPGPPLTFYILLPDYLIICDPLLAVLHRQILQNRSGNITLHESQNIAMKSNLWQI